MKLLDNTGLEYFWGKIKSVFATKDALSSVYGELKPGGRIYYGTCSTAAATNPKVCTVDAFPTENGLPVVGTMIAVKFSATNTSTSTTPQLNVNDTGAHRIWYNASALASAKSAFAGYKDRIIFYTWDGTYWVFSGQSVDNNTTYAGYSFGLGYGVQNNSSAASAITVTLASYALATGGVTAVKFNYDVPAGATLNINGKGAKSIYYRGSAISSGVIKAGDIATFVYSTYYYLISIDRPKQEVLTFDSVPTSASNNPVTSGGVYDALQDYVSTSEMEALTSSEVITLLNL